MEQVFASEEQQLVAEFFKEQLQGIFVEVGANDATGGPKSSSQTWHLEQKGWNGILVEPIQELYEVLLQNRPKAKSYHRACTSPENVGKLELLIPESSAMATLVPDAFCDGVEYMRKEEVEGVTLDSILEQEGHSSIDFLSIDVEGAEVDVLRGCTLAKYQPKLILIEDKLHSWDIHRELRRQGYKLVKRTDINGWYVPQSHTFHMSTFSERVELFRKVFLSHPFRVFKYWRKGRQMKSA